ncbi:acyl carrier protein [Nocardia altamirensis]|uniref:acyl carrier protein n=1 Tax=Nocardia altamirensis TaxID=472158 RepID=UPI0008404652|nr:acyl carrier protein [Nocardia altamirensis]
MLDHLDNELDRAELRAFVADELEFSADEITDTAEFAADLGVDSLSAMELIVVLQKKYRVKLREDELPEVLSLGVLYDLIADKLRAAVR